MPRKESIRFSSVINVTGLKSGLFQKSRERLLLRNSESHFLKPVRNQTSMLKTLSFHSQGAPLLDASDYRDIKKQMIDSAAATPGAHANVSLDNNGQKKLGGGCCS